MTEETKTVWRQTYELLAPEGAWIKFMVTDFDNPRECFCAGSAIAKVLTGSPFSLYEECEFPEMAEALHRFADHVGAPRTRYSLVRQGDVELTPATRVYGWNDHPERKKEEVLKALMELHEAEVAG